MKPTVGRIVHFVGLDEDGHCCNAAIITSVDRENEKVSLTIFQKYGQPVTEQKVRQGQNNSEAFTWHWPEREIEQL